MLYNIVNMSDRYTIDCPDLEIALVACVVLGSGQYAFEPIGHNGEVVPPFVFGGADEWCQKHLGRPLDDVVGRCTSARAAELATALDSVVIGDRDEFALVVDGLEPFSPVWLDKRAKWHDLKRSSMNDIGGRAYQIAKVLREKQGVVQPAPQQVFVV